MNITDLIVEYVKQGKSVELTSIGTISCKPAHAQGSTKNTESAMVDFSNNTTDNDNAFIQHLAEIECVDVDRWR